MDKVMEPFSRDIRDPNAANEMSESYRRWVSVEALVA